MKKLSLITVAVAVFIVGTIVSCEKKPKPTDPTENPTDPTGGTEDGIFVSKKQENRNCLFEKFTWVDCSICGSIHEYEDELLDAFPGKVFAVNMYSSNVAPPEDLSTNFSSSLRSFAANGVSGATSFYPAVMINRSQFPGNYHLPKGTLFIHGYNEGYGNWDKVINSVIDEPTYVNVAAKTTINSSDRTLSCHVQVYYTSDAPVSENNINVAVLQNEIIARQSGGGGERRTSDGKFRHMRVLRHLVTGQWGEAIESDMKKGNLYEKTFTWTIPADMRTIPIPLENVEILVFISEGKQAPVVKVCKSSIEIK